MATTWAEASLELIGEVDWTRRQFLFSRWHREDVPVEDTAWTLVVDRRGQGGQAESGRVIARVAFMVDHGPVEWLKPGSRFDLYVGPVQLVAHGVITSEPSEGSP